MSEIIKIGCPSCGSVLQVPNQEGIESKMVTCPVCKQRNPFHKFRVISDEAEPTQYAEDSQEENLIVGRLVANGVAYQLKPGKNIVGRRGKSSSADIQIPCENMRMSREHICIEVKRVPGKGFVHYASLCKQQVNPTYIGKLGLDYGDTMMLEHGMTIKLPDMDVRFELPDEESTQL